MNKKKTTLKIALLLCLCLTVVLSLASCGSNTVIDTSKGLDYWSGTAAETDAPETDAEDGSESETESGTLSEESGTEAETNAPSAEVGDKKDIVLKPESKGFIDTFLNWVGIFLGWITKVMPANSYILTLFVFAIILEIVMLPFSIKQQKNSIKQAKLRPKEMAIRRRYAGRNDQVTMQKVNQEIQELYQKENFNPMGGCLPLLIQLPVIMVLYWVVIDPIKYVFGMASEFSSFIYAYLQNAGYKLTATTGSVQLMDKLCDLYNKNPEALKADLVANYSNGGAVYEEIVNIAETNPLNLSIGELNFGLIPGFGNGGIQLWLLLIPVLTFVVYFFSMKFTRKLTGAQPASPQDKQAGCSNSMMDITMPLMSVWMTFIVPAAIGVYWIFKSIIGFVKQLIMSKVMPLPQFTEDDYKAAEREMYGKAPKRAVQKSENAGKVRSLHHIDDEDYDEKGNYVPKKEEPEEESDGKKEAKLPENSMTEGASLKDESDKASKD